MSFENLISQYSDAPAYVHNIKMAFIARPHKEWRFQRLRRERSGSVVECLTRDRRVAGSSLTGVTALWSLSKTHLS